MLTKADIERQVEELRSKLLKQQAEERAAAVKTSRKSRRQAFAEKRAAEQSKSRERVAKALRGASAKREAKRAKKKAKKAAKQEYVDPFMPVARVKHVVRRVTPEEQEEQKEYFSKEEQHIKEQVESRRTELAGRRKPQHAVIHDSEHVQTRNVRLILKARIDHFEAGKQKEDLTREITEEEYIVLKFKTKKQYYSGLKEAKRRFADKIRRLDESYKKVYVLYVDHEDTVSDEELAKHSLRPEKMKLYKVGRPIKFNFLEGVDLNALPQYDPAYQQKENESEEEFEARKEAVAEQNYEAFNCVVEYIFKTYKKKIPSLTREKIMNIMRDKSDDDKGDQYIPLEKMKEMGWSTENIQFFCDHYKISHYALDIRRNVFWKRTTSTRNYPALMYVAASGHLYPVVSDELRKAITAASAATPVGKTASVVTRAEVSEAKLAEEESKRVKHFKKLFLENVPINLVDQFQDVNIFYHQPQLINHLRELFKQNKVWPKFKMANGKVMSIHCDNNVNLYANVNHSVAGKAISDWKTSRSVCEAFDIPFENQSLPSIASTIFQRYHVKGAKQQRRKIPQSIRLQITNRQHNSCNACEKSFDSCPYEIDHIKPISSGGSNDISNLQALCKACHRAKSQLESAERIFGCDNSVSTMNEETMKIFHEHPKNAIVHNPLGLDHHYMKLVEAKKKFVFGLDITKCRGNGTLFNKSIWTVFSVLDKITRFDPSNKDHLDIPVGFYFIESDNICPLKGNGWYPYQMVEYCLAENIIELSQVKLMIKASMSLPPSYFEKFIVDVREKVEPGMSKLLINSFIGMLGIRKINKRQLYVSEDINECAMHKFLWSKPGEDVSITPRSYSCEDEEGILQKPEFYEIVYRNEQLREESHLPLFHQVLANEAIELHKTQKLLESCGGTVCHYNTDQVVAIFDSLEQVEAAKEASKLVFWDNEKKMPKYKEESKIIQWDREVIASKERVEYEDPDWKEIEDPMDNDFNKLAEKLLEMNSGFQIQAPAGCGKTHLLKEIIKFFRKNDIPFLALTPTHKARQVLDPEDAQTINSCFSGLMKAKCLTSFNKYKYLIIDEKSMVNEVYWSLLYKIKNQCPDMHIIVCGDWLQLLPVNDRYEGADCENSRMLYDMCDGIMLKLSKCRRSDKKLFDLYMDPSTVNVDDFPHEMQSRAICYTNRMRKLINAEWMEHFKKEKVVILELEAFKEDAKKMSQNMSVFKGLPVMATRTMEKYQIYNADEYVVEAIYKRKSSLILKREVGEEYERIEIKIEDFRQSFVPAYAITSHRSQGASFDMPYSIYEWEKMSDRMKYVALSRARGLKLIHIMQ